MDKENGEYDNIDIIEELMQEAGDERVSISKSDEEAIYVDVRGMNTAVESREILKNFEEELRTIYKEEIDINPYLISFSS